MARKPKPKQNEEPVKENSLAVEVGRIAKLFALYLLKDVDDEGVRIIRLSGAGFSSSEIALLLDKSENNVRSVISRAKTKRGKSGGDGFGADRRHAAGKTENQTQPIAEQGIRTHRQDRSHAHPA